ncbi:hypothetical protein HOY80DRAFT_1030801 [Tuber brumale]|nr:hypothetical protein HOY80DRAFT_1030801 [Tuber brumale]
MSHLHINLKHRIDSNGRDSPVCGRPASLLISIQICGFLGKVAVGIIFVLKKEDD